MECHYHSRELLDRNDHVLHGLAFHANRSSRCWEKFRTTPALRWRLCLIYSAVSVDWCLRHLPNGRWVVRCCRCPGQLHWLVESNNGTRERERDLNKFHQENICSEMYNNSRRIKGNINLIAATQKGGERSGAIAVEKGKKPRRWNSRMKPKCKERAPSNDVLLLLKWGICY